MRTLSLNGEWRLTFGVEGASRGEFSTIPATVPGNVEIDLMAADLLPDVFRGTNPLKTRPCEFYEWFYETTFEVPREFRGRRIELVFGGVDCLATYTLNGHVIGASENMFIEHAFEVDKFLDYDGENRLEVRIASAVNRAFAQDYDPSVSTKDYVFVRKAAHSYGWDIFPRIVSAGIWRDVTLVAREPSEFRDIHYFTESVEPEAAVLGIRYQFSTDRPTLEGFDFISDGRPGKGFAVRISGVCGDSSFEWTAAARSTAGEATIRIPNPKLWWPLGYGEANLYEITAELLLDGEIADTRTTMVGIRTIELASTDITTWDTPGEFLFRVNGVPIMCKGSNWVPADALHSRDAARYERALGLFADLGCNIVRCWGGGVYEDHAFYDLCDRYGMMVWQDFAMACARYPQTPEFQAALRKEAISVVRKLRNHACIALWSGDNECDYFYMKPEDNRLTREVLPKVVFECDHRRPYLPSSPYYSPEGASHGVAMRDRLAPEQHLWGPRDYYKSPFYKETTAHFISEIGYHGCPNISSLERFIDAECLWPWRNEQWRIHCADDMPWGDNWRNQLMVDQVKELFGFEPRSLAELAFASQASQAEALKFFIEFVRLGKWRRTGIIWWNVLDGWPQISDAVVDYYFAKKLAYHFIKRVQQPVCLMMTEPRSWHCSLVAGNDSLRDASGTYRVREIGSDSTLLEGRFDSKANENSTLGSIRVSHGEQRLFIIEWETGGRAYGNHYLHGHPPFSFADYRGWLEEIGALPDGFDPAAIGK